jgi:hypothetical protein
VLIRNRLLLGPTLQLQSQPFGNGEIRPRANCLVSEWRFVMCSILKHTKCR